MTARTLFSDSQPQLVAWVLNNSIEDKLLSADTFLSMAEPIQCLSDDGHKSATLMAKGDKSRYDALFWGGGSSHRLSRSAVHPPRCLLTRLRSALRLSRLPQTTRRLPAPPPLLQKDCRTISRACCNICLMKYPSIRSHRQIPWWVYPNLFRYTVGRLCPRMHSPIHPLAIKHGIRGDRVKVGRMDSFITCVSSSWPP